MTVGTVVSFLKISVGDDAWCIDTSLDPLLVKLSQVLESTFLDNYVRTVAIPIVSLPFHTTRFPSSPLSINMIWYSTLWKAKLLSNDLLWFSGTLLVEDISDSHLSSQQSLWLWWCMCWTRLRDRWQLICLNSSFTQTQT